MRKIMSDTSGSIYPVIIFFICIGLASFLVLIFGNVLSPFAQLSSSTDTDLAPEIQAPMGYMNQLLFGFIWPRGVLITILIGLIMWLLMDMQKNKYRETG